MTYYETKKSERIWIILFRYSGFLMFIASIFESFVTLFWIGKDVVHMDSFRICFACVGFFFAFSNKQLGSFSNQIGKILINKLKSK
jgi:hypothetical protein